MDSILASIKKLIGPSVEYDNFDADLIMHINTAFMRLHSLGVGPIDGFVIEDETSVWSDFIPSIDMAKYEGVKTYIYIKVKLVFDPPASATVLDALDRQAKELEWLLTNRD